MFRGIPGGSKTFIALYKIDRLTGTPLYVEKYTSQELYEKHLPELRAVAKFLTSVDGRLVGSDWDQTVYDANVNGHARVVESSTHHVDNIRFDKQYASSVFWPTMSPGVLVDDGVAKKHYRVPGQHEAANPVVAQVRVDPPIRVKQSVDWTPVLAWTSLGLGVAFLVTGLVRANVRRK